MQSLIRSKSAGVTGGRGTAGAGPGRDLLYHQRFKIHVKWDPATPNDKQVQRTIELWRDRNGPESVPMQLCTPHTEHLTGTEYTGEVHNAWPLPKLQKRNRKTPAAQGVIILLDA